MIKDIPLRKVEDLAIAIIPPADIASGELWDVYLLNLHPATIASVNYSPKDMARWKEKKENFYLPPFLRRYQPQSVQLIEPLQPTLFELANEYWVSFSMDEHLFDKKYVCSR
ncbi:MAG: hypothetical protein R2795_20965 [Saprospiraceae bacterium]